MRAKSPPATPALCFIQAWIILLQIEYLLNFLSRATQIFIASFACGHMAQSMAETLTGMGNCVEKYACASRDVEKSKLFAKTHGFSKAYDPTKNLSRIRKLNSYTLHLLTHTTMNTLSFAWNMENTYWVKSHSQSMHPRPVKYLALQKKKNSCSPKQSGPAISHLSKNCRKPLPQELLEK